MTHLAKSPGSAVLVSWCGHAEGRGRRAGLAHDGAPIARYGAFDCGACRARMLAELARIRALVGDLSPEREPTLSLGCSDSGCPAARPGGMRTNGGCRCELREMRAAAGAWRRYALALEGLVP